jgi:hypothetical protein
MKKAEKLLVARAELEQMRVRYAVASEVLKPGYAARIRALQSRVARLQSNQAASGAKYAAI